MLINWLKRRKELARLIRDDADNLISSFGDRAYYEARDRAQRDKAALDGNRPSGHGTRVKLKIARRQRGGADWRG
jgi:hypothetical protein